MRTAIVIPGHARRGRITSLCLALVREAERIAAAGRVDAVVFSGWAPRGGESEAEQMRAAWRGADRPGADLHVVDDGSTDGTAAVASEHGAEVVSLGSNRGLPVGIATGYRWALDHGYAFCGRVDADGQHRAEDLTRLLALVRA